jgi:hypothetical protein
MKNWHLKEFASLAGWSEEINFIDEIDFKEFL